MRYAKHHVFIFLIISVLLTCAMGLADTAHAEQGQSFSIRFPAFSLSPGDKVAGIKVKTSRGRIFTSCLPGRWRCEHQGNSIHCYALHPTHAVALTGLLPEIIIRDVPGNASKPSIEASVECLDGSGREFSREFREDELIVK